jgi:hypothetical protein
VEWVSRSVGRPSVEPNRRTGDSADSLESDSVDCKDISVDTPRHILSQSSIGKGASIIDGGIIALNFITATLLLNSGQPYSALHRSQRVNTTARSLKQQKPIEYTDISTLLWGGNLSEKLTKQDFVVGVV